jgi:hypothetical protein
MAADDPTHPRHDIRQIARHVLEAADVLDWLGVLSEEEDPEKAQDLHDRADHDRDDAAFFNAIADLVPVHPDGSGPENEPHPDQAPE